MAREPGAIVELRRALGAQLATFRLAAGLTQGQLAKVAMCDRTAVAHLEKGRARGDERFWRAADEACAAGGALLAGYLELAAVRAEYDQRERDQRLASVRAKAAELRGRVGTGSGRASDSAAIHSERPAALPALDDLRRAVLGQRGERGADRPSPSIVRQLGAGIAEAHRLYQLADYDGVARLLPPVIRQLEMTPADAHTVGRAKATAYIAAAKLATKLGDASLAWVTADRSRQLASEIEHQGLAAVANYQVACALFSGGHRADAERVASLAAENIARRSRPDNLGPEETSARGALTLLLAVMAARRGDAPGLGRACRPLRGWRNMFVKTAISCGRPSVLPTLLSTN